MRTYISRSRRAWRGVAAAAMVIVMATVTVVRMSQSTWDANDYQTFIPDHPNQTRKGKPADIPRRFLIEEADACLRKGDDVEVVAFVHSTISRVDQRRQTRFTWASSNALKMVVVFVVGRAKNDEEREIVHRESELYHDIVQGDYGDHYHLLTYKALSSLYWITRNCAHVPWTLHADDDLLIDTFLLQKFIQDEREASENNKFHGIMQWHSLVRRNGKWKVTQEEIKEKIYPPYCHGAIWYINTKQMSRLLNASTSVNFLWVDDVYLTGYLAREAKIKFTDIRKYTRKIHFDSSMVGKILAWYHTEEDRTKLWPLILHHYNFTKGKSPEPGQKG